MIVIHRYFVDVTVNTPDNDTDTEGMRKAITQGIQRELEHNGLTSDTDFALAEYFAVSYSGVAPKKA